MDDAPTIVTNRFANLLCVDGRWMVSNPVENSTAEFPFADDTVATHVPRILHYCARPRTVAAFDERFEALAPSPRAWRDPLLECGLLSDARTRWDRWGDTPLRDVVSMWAGRHVPRYVDYAADDVYENDARAMQARTTASPPPPLTKTLGAEPAVPLWHPALGFGATMFERFGSFLFSFMGTMRVGSFLGVLPVLLKTVPSNGARHPFELFVSVGDGLALPRGLWHYDTLRHRLLALPAETPYAAVAPASTVNLSFFVDYERVQWRYRESWDMHEILHDFGHLQANLKLAAPGYGFRSVAEALNPTAATDLRFDPFASVCVTPAEAGCSALSIGDAMRLSR